MMYEDAYPTWSPPPVRALQAPEPAGWIPEAGTVRIDSTDLLMVFLACLAANVLTLILASAVLGIRRGAS